MGEDRCFFNITMGKQGRNNSTGRNLEQR